MVLASEVVAAEAAAFIIIKKTSWFYPTTIAAFTGKIASAFESLYLNSLVLIWIVFQKQIWKTNRENFQKSCWSKAITLRKKRKKANYLWLSHVHGDLDLYRLKVLNNNLVYDPWQICQRYFESLLSWEGLSIGWFVGWLVGRVVGWLVCWLVGRKVGWLVCISFALRPACGSCGRVSKFPSYPSFIWNKKNHWLVMMVVENGVFSSKIPMAIKTVLNLKRKKDWELRDWNCELGKSVSL